MTDPKTVIEDTMKESCEICGKSDEIRYRIEQNEKRSEELDARFRISKKEIFDRMEKNRMDVETRLGRLNNLLIGTLTTGVVTLIVLLLRTNGG